MKKIRFVFWLSAFLLAARHSRALNPAWYFNGQLGGILLAADDANNRLSLPGATDSGFIRRVWLAGDLRAGYQFPGWFGMETGLGLGPNRSFGLAHASPQGESSTNASWTAYSWYLAPLARFESRGPMFERPFFQSLGLKMGLAGLSGKVDAHVSNPGNSVKEGSFDQTSTTWVAGLFYRFEQALSDRLGAGVEFGYDYCKFSYLVNANGTGLFAGGSVQSPDRNPDGSQAGVDFSGPYVKLSLSYWLTDPSVPATRPSPQP